MTDLLSSSCSSKTLSCSSNLSLFLFELGLEIIGIDKWISPKKFSYDVCFSSKNHLVQYKLSFYIFGFSYYIKWSLFYIRSHFWLPELVLILVNWILRLNEWSTVLLCLFTSTNCIRTNSPFPWDNQLCCAANFWIPKFQKNDSWCSYPLICSRPLFRLMMELCCQTKLLYIWQQLRMLSTKMIRLNVRSYSHYI